MVGQQDRRRPISVFENRAADVEIYNFSVPQAGPREYAALVEREVHRYRPDLVLAIIAVETDILESAPLPTLFDPRSLRLYQWTTPASRQESGPQQQASLDQRASRLSLCRTPLSPQVRQRWQEVDTHLDKLIAHCERHRLPVAIAVVPATYQVNQTLQATLQRRQGYTSDQLDLQLPQRHLSEFARTRGVPVLDLLPHLRASTQPVHQPSGDKFTTAGHTLLATTLSAWLQSQIPSRIAAAPTTWR